MQEEKPSKPSGALTLPKLIPGILLKRYKRFMADVKLETGDVVTAHCPNSGSMQACSEPGSPVYLSYHDNPKRKLKYTWELIEMPASLVGVNTQVPNRLVAESITAGRVEELGGYENISREVRVGSNSRLDILLTGDDKDPCYVEVKNCTLVDEGVACFPDAVTSRGLKHLVEMRRLVSSGNRCVMFYLIQRMDAEVFRPADHIDPEYGRELRRVAGQGVEIVAYDVLIDLKTITLNEKIPCRL
ncbi:MAG: DNA/RNA nuclease SfsA [Deltaproteobacteria bacterium]|nr:DNA/RNA nuclease SfsA [Deltaproteobacteria bacterium]